MANTPAIFVGESDLGVLRRQMNLVLRALLMLLWDSRPSERGRAIYEDIDNELRGERDGS